MGISEVTKQLQDAKKLDQRIGFMGLKIRTDDLPIFKESIDELIEYVEELDTENLYRLDVKIDRFMFLNITINVSYLQGDEVGQPIGLVRVARNIKAFDTTYERSDDHSVWKFWSNLSKKLNEKLRDMDDSQKAIVKQLAGDSAGKFGLI